MYCHIPTQQSLNRSRHRPSCLPSNALRNPVDQNLSQHKGLSSSMDDAHCKALHNSQQHSRCSELISTPDFFFSPFQQPHYYCINLNIYLQRTRYPSFPVTVWGRFPSRGDQSSLPGSLSSCSFFQFQLILGQLGWSWQKTGHPQTATKRE